MDCNEQETLQGKDWYYNVYLKSDEWKEIRGRIIEKYGHKCACCGSSENLRVHHLYYNSASSNEQDDERNLVCLCDSCHIRFHRAKDFESKILEGAINSASMKFKTLASGFISDTIDKLREIQAEAAVFALDGHSTKHLAKLQSYFTFYTLSVVKDIVDYAISEMNPQTKQTMQLISELRKQRKQESAFGKEENDWVAWLEKEAGKKFPSRLTAP